MYHIRLLLQQANRNISRTPVAGLQFTIPATANEIIIKSARFEGNARTGPVDGRRVAAKRSILAKISSLAAAGGPGKRAGQVLPPRGHPAIGFPGKSLRQSTILCNITKRHPAHGSGCDPQRLP